MDSSSLLSAGRIGHKKTPSMDRVRYYYEDGRGNKVWVQNLVLDYDARRWDQNTPSGSSGKCSHEDPYSMLHRPRMRRQGSSCCKSSSAGNRAACCGETPHIKAVPRKDLHRIYEATSMRCSCPCHMRSLPSDRTTDGSDVLSTDLKWTFLTESSLGGLIHTVEDAEFVLEKLRNEEDVLHRAYMPRK